MVIGKEKRKGGRRNSRRGFCGGALVGGQGKRERRGYLKLIKKRDFDGVAESWGRGEVN